MSWDGMRELAARNLVWARELVGRFCHIRWWRWAGQRHHHSQQGHHTDCAPVKTRINHGRVY
jgi:hypothetical protein